MEKHLPAMLEIWLQSLCREDPLQMGMATHSGILSWKILWTEDPCRLQPMGSQRAGHNWATSLSFFFKKCTKTTSGSREMVRRGEWQGGCDCTLAWGFVGPERRGSGQIGKVFRKGGAMRLRDVSDEAGGRDPACSLLWPSLAPC